MRSYSSPLCCLAFAVVCVSCAASPPPRAVTAPAPAPPPAPSAAAAAASLPVDPIGSKIDALFADYAKPGVPGCAVGAYRAGEIVFARGYGSANLEQNIPITPSTVFEIGSVSKQFTATAVLLLAADGKLSLDDDVRKYIPELPASARVITLRHLLHHTGGLREYDTLLTLCGYTSDDVAPEAEALHLVTLQRGTNFPAGTEWSYSNTGYFLLGQVVRRVTGTSLAAFSKARIFEPLGMTSTLILDDHTKLVPRRATSYEPRKEGGFAIDMSYREETGEGNIQSSIEDLARWDANFYTPTVGGASWLTTMRTPGKLDDGKPLTYAMGLQLGSSGGLATEEHSGGWAGYRADLIRVPSERLGVVVLCNVGDVNPVALAKSVAAVFVPQLEQASPTAPASPTNASAAPPKLSDADAAMMVGTYVDPRSLALRTIARKDGELRIGLGVGADAPPPRKLEWRGARTLRVAGTTTDYAFEPADHGKSARLVRTADVGPARTFERVAPAAIDAAGLAPYAGRYRSEEMTHDLQLVVKDGALRAGSLGKTLWDDPLTPIARDTFSAGGVGARFERDAHGKVAVLVLYDGYPGVRWKKVEDAPPPPRK